MSAALTPLPLCAEIVLPANAEQTSSSALMNSTFEVPIGPWINGNIETLDVTGNIEFLAWRVPNLAMGTHGLMQSLQDAMAKDGYTTLFQCATNACGGFDFRYATKVVSEPEMHVDLGDFQFVAAKRDTVSGPEHISLLVSRADTVGFVQIVHIGRQIQASAVATKSDTPEIESAPANTGPAKPMAGLLETNGRIVLDDLIFASGATELGQGTFVSLTELASYLADHPTQQVVIVGHTDASGALPVNVAVSRKRAQSVVDRLVNAYGVAKGQISAEGVGFLSPVDTNLTEEGRRKNRRVEAVLASTR